MARTDNLKHFLVDIADKIRARLGTSVPILHAEYDTKIDEVYDAGKTAEHERFWEKALASKLPTPENTSRGLEYTFSDSFWNDDTLNIPEKYLPLKPTSTNYPFRYCGATILPSVDFTNCPNLNYTYAYARNAVTIGTIILREDGTNTFTTTFTYCDVLENITFEGVIGSSVSFGRSPNLSSASIDNIIEHLADLTGQSAQTITFHSTTAKNLTTEQINAIGNKNWTVG